MVDLTLPDPSPPPDAGDAAARLAARVQAWQHRNPLARRLPATDVNGMGVIALPFGPPATAGGKPQPLFHQPSLVPGLSHRALVEFALRHAVTYRPGPTDWPLREVERADASPDPAPETRYLLTAAITEPVKPGAQPRRLLIAPEGKAIWGPRPLSRRRVAEAVGVLVLILFALGWGQRGRFAGGGTAPAPAASVAPLAGTSAAMSAHPVSAPASMGAVASGPASSAAPRLPASAPAAALVAASGALPAATRAATASLPASAQSPTVMPASASKPGSAPARAPSSPISLAASAPAVPASVALPPPPKLLPMPALRGAAAASAAAASAPTPAASAVSPTGPHFALVSLPSKKRAGAEETLARIHKLLGPAIGNLQAQIMPSPDGFVVTIWPLPTEADAEQLANVLARRGVPMKWLEF